MNRLSLWVLVFIIACFFLNFSLVAAQAEESEEDLQVGDEEDIKDGGAGHQTAEDDEEEVEEEEEEEELYKPHPSVRTVVHFLDAKDKKFPVATRIVALIGFHNKGDLSFNVTAVGAAFHSPYDLDYYIQNFTAREVGFIVPPKTQATFEYAFLPDKSLEPLDYWLSGMILYNGSDGQEYRSVWTNGTFELVEKDSEFDVRKLFSYFLLFSMIGLVGYVVYSTSQSGGKKKTRRTAAERGTRAPVETRDEDWGGAYVPMAVARKASRKVK